MKALKVIFCAFLLSLCAVSAGAQELNFKGYLAVTKGDNASMYEDVTFNIKLNPEKKTADFTTVGMKFGDRMPGNLTIFFGDVPYSENCGEYSFDAELLNPTVDGKPGTAKIRDFSATTLSGKALTVIFEAGRVLAQYDGEAF